MTTRVNFIGAGRLGQTLAHLLVKHQLAIIGSVCNLSTVSAEAAIAFIGQGQACPTIENLLPADITFITTPDSAISAVAEALSKNCLIPAKSIIVHCSGSLSAGALGAMKKRGAYLASVHPMQSFAKPTWSIEGTYCAIEGDEEALPTLHALFRAIGAVTYVIEAGKKTLYHAAGVYASNYLIALAQEALSCMRGAGLSKETAMQAITRLMRSTLSNLEKTESLEQALTGPIQRGDVDTLLNHMAILKEAKQEELYAILGKALLPLIAHTDEKKASIAKALTP